MTDTVAAGQLRAFVERIERIEADIKDRNADKSEVYKEAKGTGFDVKVLRKVVSARRLDHAERMESESLFDMYMAALEGNQGLVRAHVENIEEFDPETGELHDPESEADASGEYQRDTAQSVPAHLKGGDTDAGGLSRLPISPGSHPPADPDGDLSIPSPEAGGAKMGGLITSPDRAAQAVHANANSGQAVEPFEPPQFLQKERKPAGPQPNPDCQKPASCRWSHSQASCSKCANDAAIKRQGRAA